MPHRFEVWIHDVDAGTAAVRDAAGRQRRKKKNSAERDTGTAGGVCQFVMGLIVFSSGTARPRIRERAKDIVLSDAKVCVGVETERLLATVSTRDAGEVGDDGFDGLPDVFRAITQHHRKPTLRAGPAIPPELQRVLRSRR